MIHINFQRVIPYSFLFIGLVLFTACGSSKKTVSAPPSSSPTSTKIEEVVVAKQTVAKPAKEVKIQTTQEAIKADIKARETKLYKTIDGFNTKDARTTLNKYLSYIESYPDDTAYNPEALFKAAELHRSLKEYDASIGLMQDIIDQYPSYNKVPQCQFLIGFTYENNLEDFDNARKAYEIFLEKYPDHILKNDVSFSIKHLGMSPQDIIKSYEAERKSKEAEKE